MSRNCNNCETVDGVHYMPCPNRTWWTEDGVFCQLLRRFVKWLPRKNVYSLTVEEPTTNFPEGCPHHVPDARVSTENWPRLPQGDTSKEDADYLETETHEDVTRKYAGKIQDILKAAISDGCDDDEVMWLAKVFHDQSATLGEQNPTGHAPARSEAKGR